MDLGKNTDEIDEVPPIPDWVLDNCVKTLSELARLETRIVLRDGHLEEKTTLQDNKYEMLSCMYQDLLDLVSPPFDVNVKVTLTSNTETTPKQGCFTNDGVILRLPGDNGTSPGFFLAVIEHFARDIGADMVKLSIQDIDALSDCLLEHQVNKRKTLIPAIKPENQSPKATQNQGDLKDDDPSKKRELADESEAETISRDQSPSDTPGSETPSQPDFGSPNNSDCNDPKTKADAPQGSPDVEPGGASNEKSNSAKQSNNNSSKDQKWSKHNPKTTIEDSKEEDTDNDERSIGSSSSDSGSEYTIPPTVVFYRQIIARLQEKRLQEQEQDGNSTQQKPLLIIVILEVFGVVSQSPSTLSHLRECINSPPGDHTVLLIATDQTASSRCPPPPPPLPPPPPPQSHHMYSLPLPSSRPPPSPSRDSRTLCMFSHNPVREAIEIVPLWSPSQKHLFSQEKEADIVASNIWTLQREVKRLVSKKDAPILQPYNGWKLQSGSDSEKFLKQSQLSDQKSRSIATRIAKDFSVVDLDELVANELGRVEARTKAIDKWNEGNEGNSESSNKWSRLPPHVYKAVKQIEGDPQKFKREIGLLDNVVDPDTVEETWADIALQPKIKTYINQLVSLVVSKEKSRGILKTSHIGGAILYGPPGTGKTQLARVLSKESRAVMIQVSSAEMEHKWIGETPKLIKALFNLGRLLSPCIIFIDEADSLFRARGSHDFSFDRTKSSQLLNEADGLRKSNSAPFLLLATNHPDQLDHAFLRRVPGRIYVGLPDEEARLKMLNIFLRDEELDPGVDLESLAKKTENYTGSDIKVLSVQAAMIFLSEEQDDSSSGASDTKKLRMSHFEDAIRRTSPTVREPSMAAIRNFAKEFDPLVVKSIYLKDNPAWRDTIACEDHDEPHQNASMYL